MQVCEFNIILCWHAAQYWARQNWDYTVQIIPVKFIAAQKFKRT